MEHTERHLKLSWARLKNYFNFDHFAINNMGNLLSDFRMSEQAQRSFNAWAEGNNMEPKRFTDVYTQTDLNALNHFDKGIMLICGVCVVGTWSRRHTGSDLWWDEALEELRGLREHFCGK